MYLLHRIEVKKKTPINTTVYEDSKVKITFLRVEKYKYGDDRVSVYCDVENKTNETITIQCDALSLNGYSFNNVIMSDDVSANCIGTVDTTLSNFNFSLVDINNITSFGGQYRIISDDKTFKTYTATLGKTSSKDDDDEYNSESSTSSASTSSTYQVYAGTKVPTFTGVTGIPLKATDNTSTQKIYRYQGLEKITDYMDFLTANGWTFYYKDVDEVKRISHFCYKKNGEIVVISLVNLFTENETWISVDK